MSVRFAGTQGSNMSKGKGSACNGEYMCLVHGPLFESFLCSERGAKNKQTSYSHIQFFKLVSIH
jgi:hypothetical protein